MKKKLKLFVFLMGLLVSMTMTVYGETSYGDSNWSVTFSTDKKMVSNFKTADLDEVIYGMQPGDDVVITMALKNDNETSTDWYMTNEVLYSLEDRSANAATGGGAYMYKLTYISPTGTKRSLFDSDTVGGESDNNKAGEGLKQATNALDDWLFLDTLAKGQSAQITLEVALDGDTQGNDYQNTLADLRMNFAVELNETATRRATTPTQPGRSGNVVRTGDDTDITRLIIIACVSGILFLGLAGYGQLERAKEKKGGGAS